MSDSNEIKHDQKHPRLRLPQAGIKAQEDHDAGEPLTTESVANILNGVMLDYMNGRITREEALTIVQVTKGIMQAAALELKDRELYYTYDYKYEQSIERSGPLVLAGGRKKHTTLKRKAS